MSNLFEFLFPIYFKTYSLSSECNLQYFTQCDIFRMSIVFLVLREQNDRDIFKMLILLLPCRCATQLCTLPCTFDELFSGLSIFHYSQTYTSFLKEES